MQIARGCSQLQYLQLYVGIGTDADLFVEAVCALPHLHTLVISVLPEDILLAVARRGHPSLCVVDTGTVYTYDGLRQITATMPQLTGLAIYDFTWDAHTDLLDLLQHCGNLQLLSITAQNENSHYVQAILESAAQHCRNLRTFIIDNCTEYEASTVNALVANCPHLLTVRVYNTGEISVPPNRPGLVVTSNSMAVTEWMPNERI